MNCRSSPPASLTSAPAAVMTVTPAAKVPSALRKSRGSIGELLLAYSSSDPGRTSVTRQPSLRPPCARCQAFRWQIQRDLTVVGSGGVVPERTCGR